MRRSPVAGGKVKLNDERVKVAKEVKPGDALAIRIGEYEWAVVVTALSEKRGSAEIARTLYKETKRALPDAWRRSPTAARRPACGANAARAGRPSASGARWSDSSEGNNDWR